MFFFCVFCVVIVFLLLLLLFFLCGFCIFLNTLKKQKVNFFAKKERNYLYTVLYRHTHG